MTRWKNRSPLARVVNLALTALGVILAGGALALAPAGAANAHDFLVNSTPAADSTQTTPLNTVTLTFSDVVLDLGGGSSSIVQVTDAKGRHFETACAANRGRDVIAPVALGAPGTYTVAFQTVSADGHTISNEFTFDYAPPAGTEAAEGTAQSACAAAGQTSSAPDAVAPLDNNADNDAASDADRAEGEAALGAVLTIVGVVFAVVVIGVLAAIFFARKKPRA